MGDRAQKKTSLKSKKRANLYVHMTAKSPALFLFLIVASIGILLFISFSTKLDIIKTYEAQWDGSKFILKDSIPLRDGIIYAYENLNDKVYTLTIHKEDISYIETTNSTVVTCLSVPDASFSFSKEDVMLDIPIGTETLFQRVFLHGGTNE